MSWYADLDFDTYETAKRLFEWEVPNDYNIAWDLIRKHRDRKGTVALFQAYPDGRRETYTFHDIDVLSNQIAHGLRDLGVGYGDRVAIVSPQKPAYPLTHLACWKIGAISVPISVLYGTDGLRYRLQHSEAEVAVVDRGVVDDLGDDALTDPSHVIEIDGDGQWPSFADLHVDQPRSLTLADTDGDTPAVLLYTSGTTGDPKGVLHTHDVWIGHYLGFYMKYELDVDTSVFWTPTEWSWMGTLVTSLCPPWHFGRPVVGYPMEKFDPRKAFEIMEEFGVTDTFLPPTAIRMMMDVDEPGDDYDLDLKAISAGGEPVTNEVVDWAEAKLEGTVINEGYGRTEGTSLIVTCQSWFDARRGSMGRAVPGHEVAVLDPETGEEQPRGEFGEIAVKRDNDPGLFEGYWQDPETTEEGRAGGWDLTGDLAKQDEDGYFWFKSRKDDIIITSGYRVGPSEIEDVILEHEDVKQVGVVGVDDDVRGEIIKAFIQPASGVEGTDALREEIQQFVRDRLAKHQYPRQIEFVDELPQTTTGKIRRAELRDQAD